VETERHHKHRGWSARRRALTAVSELKPSGRRPVQCQQSNVPLCRTHAGWTSSTLHLQAEPTEELVSGGRRHQTRLRFNHGREEDPVPDLAPQVGVRVASGSRAAGWQHGARRSVSCASAADGAAGGLIEDLPKALDYVVVLGDFNRNLGHEAAQVKGAEPVLSDGTTDLSRPRAASVVTRNLLLEVNDAQPPASRLTLMSPVCTGSADLASACDAAKTRLLTSEERRVLTDRSGLGCRYPVGLNHILVYEALAKSVMSTFKVPLGILGRALSPMPPQNPEPLLAVSDPGSKCTSNTVSLPRKDASS
jgi:hypothetical protein